MMNVQLEEDQALNMLVSRVEYWTDDLQVVDLFAKMYEKFIESGACEGREFNVWKIVDHDYMDYCDVIREDDPLFKKILKAYEKDTGLWDISDITDYNCLEAVDDEDDPTMFLVRY